MIGAVIPAAGKSKRMGQPKLLIEIDGRALLARVIEALFDGGVGRIVVVCPPESAPESAPLATIANESGCELVIPREHPLDMRASIELGLGRLGRSIAPDHVVVGPGDSPATTAPLIASLLERASRNPRGIVIPSVGGRRGHPIVMPWAIARELAGLGANLGLNALVRGHSDLVELVEVADRRIVLDLDTPEDLAAWRGGAGGLVSYRVRLFAGARELAGKGHLEIELAPGSTVADLRRALGLSEPRLGMLVARAMIAVDEDYAADDQALPASARLALIPPVSGGTTETPTRSRGVGS